MIFKIALIRTTSFLDKSRVWVNYIKFIKRMQPQICEGNSKMWIGLFMLHYVKWLPIFNSLGTSRLIGLNKLVLSLLNSIHAQIKSG